MASLKLVVCLALICSVAYMVQAEDGHKVPHIPPNADGDPRFLDELFSEMGNLKVEKYVNQGQSVVKQVQTMHGSHGGTKIIQTEVSESYGNHPGMRFKRDLFSAQE